MAEGRTNAERIERTSVSERGSRDRVYSTCTANEEERGNESAAEARKGTSEKEVSSERGEGHEQIELEE